MKQKSTEPLSISNLYLEQIAALAKQHKNALSILMFIATKMDDENVACCTRKEIHDKIGGRERDIPVYVKTLCKYGFLHKLKEDTTGWELVVNPLFMVRGEPAPDKEFSKWPAGVQITGPYLVSHDKWVENNLSPVCCPK